MLSHIGGGATAAIASVIMLFIVSVALHRRLYLDRPDTSRLTLFYMIMSAGGALGGVFAALLAPLVFDWVWEHPLLVLGAAMLVPLFPYVDWKAKLGLSKDNRRGEVAIIGIALALSCTAIHGGAR